MPFPALAFLRTAVSRRALISLACVGAGLAACLPLSAQTYQFTNIADSATATPDGTTFTNFYVATGNEPSLNNGGTVAFYAATGGSSPGTGVFMGGTGGLQAIAREGGSYSGGTFGSFANLVVPRINDAGTVAFGNVGSTGYGVFTGGTGGLQVVARPYLDPLPNGTYFTSLGFYPAINSSGTVAFLGQSPIGGDPYAIGIYTSSGGSLNPIARVGDTVTGGVITNIFSSPGINNAGQTVFFATITGATTSGLFIGDATGIHPSAQLGQTVPSGGTINGISAYPAINDSGTVAFYASTLGGASTGVYTENAGTLNAIAQVGDAAPGGGIFDYISINQGINAAGEVVFEADVAGGTLPGLGLFIHTSSGNQRIIGTNDALFGSTVTNFYFDDSGLNNAGQVAFSYQLANGVSGIAFGASASASVPEPGAVALFGAGGFSLLGLAALRRRRSA